MPANWGLYLYGAEEGTEVSSTYEGRHITCTAAELITDSGAQVATKGHACIFGLIGLQAVGVCFNTGTGTDLIAIDTEGVWNLPVYGKDDGGDRVLRPGEPVFIHNTSCEISGLRDNATQVPFGYLLTEVASGAETISVVKVHWDPRSHWLQDEEKLYFGDDRDVSIEWDAGIPALEMLPLVNDTGAFNIGDGTFSMNVQIFGMNAATSLLYDSSLGNLDIVNTVATPGDSVFSILATMALPASAGVIAYWESFLNGASAGAIYNVGNWVSLGATFADAASWLTPYESGIYAVNGATTFNVAYGGYHQFVGDATAKPANHLCVWHLNVQAGLGPVDALIHAANADSVGWTAQVAEVSVALASIPIFVSGTGAAPGYIRVYPDVN